MLVTKSPGCVNQNETSEYCSKFYFNCNGISSKVLINMRGKNLPSLITLIKFWCLVGPCLLLIQPVVHVEVVLPFNHVHQSPGHLRNLSPTLILASVHL